MPICGLLAGMTMLTGCGGGLSAQQASLQLYQPRVLLLSKGQTIATPQGQYTPQTDEIWHSARAFNELEQELINVTAAYTQKANK